MPLLIKKHSKLKLTIYHTLISALYLLYSSYRDIKTLFPCMLRIWIEQVYVIRTYSVSAKDNRLGLLENSTFILAVKMSSKMS